MITNRGIVPHFIPSSELEAHTNHKRTIKRGEIQSYIYYYWSVRYREKNFFVVSHSSSQETDPYRQIENQTQVKHSYIYLKNKKYESDRFGL